ncbi:hypothetical protein CHUAL_008283 [Chamberlinius hualienensis]
MSQLEYIVSISLWYLAPSLTGVLILLLACLRISKRFSNLWFAIIYDAFSVDYVLSDDVNRRKKILFSEMNKMAANCETGLKVLEIGAGPGNNFPFYPNNTNLTLLEPNKNFEDCLKKKEKTYPNVKLEKIVIGFGEDMSLLKDNYFDFVVASFVLCSVRDVNAVIKEISRVLVPGGSYLFVEHGYGKRSFFQHSLQHLLNPIWRVFGDGCQIIKNTLVDIQDCGLFDDVSYIPIPTPSKARWFLRLFLGDAVCGIAKIPTAINNRSKRVRVKAKIFDNNRL